jgi:hypothetical protein
MKKINLIPLSICLILLAAPATVLAGAGPRKAAAKAGTASAFVARFDRNGNGTLDADEKEALRNAYASLSVYDTNKDGKLDDSELTSVQVPAKRAGKQATKGKPAKKKQ